MVRFLQLLGGALAALALLYGDARGEDFEGALPPSGWTLSAGAVSSATQHFKSGSASMQWSWSGSSELVATNPSGAALIKDAGLSTSANTFEAWIYCESALSNRIIRFDFFDQTNSLQYSFDFQLGYAGWRKAVRRFTQDMTGIRAARDLYKARISAPTGIAGTVWIDRLSWATNNATRVRDSQNPGISGSGASSRYFEDYFVLAPTGAAPVATAQELAELAAIRTKWLTENAGGAPSSSEVASAIAVLSTSVFANATNVWGRPIVTDSADSFWESPLNSLGRSVFFTSSASSSQMVVNVARHWIDQGLGADTTETMALWYNWRSGPQGLIFARNAYDAALRRRLWDMFVWHWRMGECWATDWTGRPRNTDDVYTGATEMLGAILFLAPSDDESVRWLKGWRTWIEHEFATSGSDEDGIKVDGCGFHHTSHYNAYMYAYDVALKELHSVSGTSFIVSSGTYENLRRANLAILDMSQNRSTGSSCGFYPNSLCGRHPGSTTMAMSKAELRQLAEVGADYATNSADPVVARVYNRIFNSDYAPFASFGVQPDPSGFHCWNYSPVGVHRWSNWVAGVHGMCNNFWGSEIYRSNGDNIYGRYQSYGALEILYPGSNLVASGYSFLGWDWNRVPGATTIDLPFSLLQAEYATGSEASALNFAGGLGIRGREGLYACNFREMESASRTNHNGTFAWRKSAFFFDGSIVCLGSGITNDDVAHPTITTLFQGLIVSNAATYCNGTAYSNLGTLVSFTPTNSWLVDAYGTGYFAPSGTTIRLRRDVQVTPLETDTGLATNPFASAWFDHGTNPSSAGYEYLEVPATGASNMAASAAAWSVPGGLPYEVAVLNTNAHVVKWKSSGATGYALFTAAQSYWPTGLALRAASMPCLAMTVPETNGLRISVVNPDLLFVSNVCVRTTAWLTVEGVWAASTCTGTLAVVAATPTNTTLAAALQDGLPAEALLQPVSIAGVNDLSATAAAGGVRLVWDANNTPPMTYEIQRQIGGGSWTPVAQPSSDASTWVDLTAPAGSSCVYRVRVLYYGATGSWTTASSVLAPASRNLIANPGFENGTNGWTRYVGGSSAVATNRNPLAGLGAGVASNRIAVSSGLQQDLTAILQSGRVYACSAWVKVSGTNTAPVSLGLRRVDGVGTQWLTAGSANASSDSWTRLQGYLKPVSVGLVTSQLLYLTGPPTGVVLVADDVCVVTNTPPSVSVPAAWTTVVDRAFAMTVDLADSEFDAASLTLSAASSNATLVASNAIALAGTGWERTLVVTPSSNATGRTLLQFAVSDGAATGTASCEVLVLSRTEAWRLDRFGTVSNAGTAADNADPDLDGNRNLVEFFAGTDPMTPDVPWPDYLAVSNNAWVIGYRCSDAALHDVNHALEGSTNILSWGGSNAVGEVVSDDGTNQQRRLVVPYEDGAAGFRRLKVWPR